jgi:hypothetical protein
VQVLPLHLPVQLVPAQSTAQLPESHVNAQLEPALQLQVPPEQSPLHETLPPSQATSQLGLAQVN